MLLPDRQAMQNRMFLLDTCCKSIACGPTIRDELILTKSLHSKCWVKIAAVGLTLFRMDDDFRIAHKWNLKPCMRIVEHVHVHVPTRTRLSEHLHNWIFAWPAFHRAFTNALLLSDFAHIILKIEGPSWA